MNKIKMAMIAAACAASAHGTAANFGGFSVPITLVINNNNEV